MEQSEKVKIANVGLKNFAQIQSEARLREEERRAIQLQIQTLVEIIEEWQSLSADPRLKPLPPVDEAASSLK